MPTPAERLAAELSDRGTSVASPGEIEAAVAKCGLVLTDAAHDAAHRDWELRLRNGTLSERAVKT